MPRLRVVFHRALNPPPSEPEQHELEIPGVDDVTIEGAPGGPLLLATLKAQVASITVRLLDAWTV